MAMDNDSRYLSNITDYLSNRAVRASKMAKNGLTDLAVLSENFYCDFLNILLDCHFINENVEHKFSPGFDLIDRDNKIVAQVSVTCSPKRIREKIQSSINKSEIPEEGSWHFYFVPLTIEAPTIKKQFVLTEGLLFDPQRDILDIERILQLAQTKPKDSPHIIDKLKKLSDVVDRYNEEDAEQTSQEPQKVNLCDNIPRHLTNVGFVDESNVLHRSSIISTVIERLSPVIGESFPSKCNILLCGFGGCGKTSIARVVYGKMLKAVDEGTYLSIGWIDYNKSLKHSILYANAIKLCQYETDEDRRWKAIKKQLLSNDSNKKILLFIDNVDQDAALEQWPQRDSDLRLFIDNSNINVVFTSRLSESVYSESLYTLEVPFFSEEECLDLFYYFWKEKSRTERDISLIKQLIHRAKNHTYAVKLLASGARFINLEHYVKEINEVNFQFTINKGESSKVAADELQRLFRIKTRTKQQMNILYSFSALPQTNLNLDEVSFLLGFSRIELQPLVDESWLTYQGGFTIHPLIKEVLQMDYVAGKAPEGTMKHLLTVVASNQLIKPDDSFADIIRKISIVEHVERLVVVPIIIAVDFYYNLGMIEYECGRKRLSSLSYLKKSLRFCEGLPEDEKAIDKVAMIRYQLGYIKSTTSEYRAEAKEDLAKALSIWQSLGGHEDEIDMAQDHLGYVLADSPETYPQASKYLRLALLSREKKYRASKSRNTAGNYATTCDNLGYLLMKSTPPSAETYGLLKRAYDIRNEIYRTFGDNITEVAWTAYNIGLYLSNNNLSKNEAETYLKQALALRRKQNKDHPNVYTGNIVLTLVELAKLLIQDRNRLSEVIELLDEAEKLGNEIDDEHTGFFFDDVKKDIDAMRKELICKY